MRNVLVVLVVVVTSTARAQDAGTANPPPWKRGDAAAAPTGPKTFEQMTRDERERKAKELHSDPAAQRVVWSAWLCEAQRSRDEARTVLAQKDAERAADARQEIVDADANTKKARAALAALKASALPCSDDLVGRVARCVGRLCLKDAEALTYAESQGPRTMRAGLMPESIPAKPSGAGAPGGLPPWRRQR